MQSSLNALEHEFQKLSVEQGTDAILNLARVDGYRRRLCRESRYQQREDEDIFHTKGQSFKNKAQRRI
jgi:hypothetical protein